MNNNLTEQALWLTLAGAFMPPQRLEIFAAFRNDLVEDLTELCGVLELDVASDLFAFNHAVARFVDQEALLIEYSQLFLQPPIPATLNLARYVDGSLNGPCVDALENAYLRIGIVQRDTLRDTPDHVTMQLETMACLLGEEQPAISPTAFAQICLFGALPRLAVTIANESPESPYLLLARIAATAIRGHAVEPSPEDQHKFRHAERRADTNLGVWRHCKSCDKPFVREKEIAIMTKALSQAGLPSEHLALCPDCRDVVQGYFKRAIK